VEEKPEIVKVIIELLKLPVTCKVLEEMIEQLPLKLMKLEQERVPITK